MDAVVTNTHSNRQAFSQTKVSMGWDKYGSNKPESKLHGKFKKCFSDSYIGHQAETSASRNVHDKFRSAGNLKRGTSFRKSFAIRLKSLPSFRQKFQYTNSKTKSLYSEGITKKEDEDAMAILVGKISQKLQNKNGKGFRKRVFRKFRSRRDLLVKEGRNNKGSGDFSREMKCSNATDQELKSMTKTLQKDSSTSTTMKLKSRLTSVPEEVDFTDLITPVAFCPGKFKVPNKSSINQSAGTMRELAGPKSRNCRAKQITKYSTPNIGGTTDDVIIEKCAFKSTIEKGTTESYIDDAKLNNGLVYKDNGLVVIAECSPNSPDVISPTCADIYGQDEGIDVSFSLSHEHVFPLKQTIPNRDICTSLEQTSSQGHVKVFSGKDSLNVSEKTEVIMDTIEEKSAIKIDHESGNEIQREFDTAKCVNMTGPIDNTSANVNKHHCNKLNIDQAVLESFKKQGNASLTGNSAQHLNRDDKLLKSSDIKVGSHVKMEEYDKVDNPWILRTDIVEVSEKVQEPSLKSQRFISEYSVDDSLGFSINQWNENENKCSNRNSIKRESVDDSVISQMARSDSIESVDSFSSSIHSAHSEDLFFSASEPEVEPDQISISSAGSSPVGKPMVLLKIDEADENTSPAVIQNFEVHANNQKNTSKDKLVVKSLNDLNKIETGITSTPRRISSYLASLRSLSFESSEKKAGKYDKLNQRRSLDSNLKIQQMSLDLNMNESPAITSKLTNSSDSGLSSALSPVNEKNKKSTKKMRRHTMNVPGDEESVENQSMKNKLAKSIESVSNIALSPVVEKTNKSPKKMRRRTVDVPGDEESRKFYTLPARRKFKSNQQESPRRRVTRIASISKLFSDKAQSLSNIRLGSSFKLRNNDGEKNKVPSFLKTSSLTNLMAKKGAEMASSLSTLIRGRSNSNIVENSPFKQKEKPKIITDKEEKRELHFEKVRIFRKRERPITCEEFTAWKRRLTLNVELANTLTAEETMRLRADSFVRKSHWSGPASENGSIGAVRSPTLLDEIMKSVDNTRFRSLGSAGDMDFNETDDEDSSNEGTVNSVFKNQMSISDSSPRTPFDLPLAVCHKCGNVLNTTNDANIPKHLENTVNGKLSHSLCDLRRNCKCTDFQIRGVKSGAQNTRKKLMIGENKQEINSPISSEFSGISSSSSSPNSTDISSIQRSPKFLSMFELRNGEEERQSAETHDKENLALTNSSPGFLLRHKPMLDLSADNLDVTDETDSGVVIYETDRRCRERRSQSCDDITNCDTKLNTPDGDSFFSCTDMAESDMLSRSHDSHLILPATKSHSCDDILNEAEHILIDNGLKNDDNIQHKKEVRKAKVKSLSSSHDALSLFVHMECFDIDAVTDNNREKSQEREQEIRSGKSKDICETSESSLEIITSESVDMVDITCGVNVCDRTKPGQLTCESDERNIVKTATEDTTKECLTCNELTQDTIKNVVGDNNGLVKKRGRTLSEKVDRDRTLSSKPPLPRNSNRRVLSVNDIRTQSDKLGSTAPSNNKRYSMIEMSSKQSTENISIIESNSKQIENNDGKDNLQKLTVKSQSCDFINSTSSTPKSVNTNSLNSASQKFLFDKEHIQSYTLKSTEMPNKHTPIQKSVSSGNVPKDSFDSHSSTNSSYSMFSLNHLSQSYTNDVFRKLSSPSPPQPALPAPEKLLSLDGFINFSDTKDGFSRFSELPTSPDVFPDVSGPDMDTVFKYDVCLGYLLHSVQCDNRIVCFYSFQRNKQLMESLITPLAVLPDVLNKVSNDKNHVTTPKQPSKAKCEDLPNPAAPITSVPSERLLHAGQVLRTVLLARAPHMIRDRKFHLRTYRRCMVGTEMVDWLMQQCSLVHTRNQAVGMWQALLEEGVVVHVCHEHQFQDKYLFYRFHEDDEGVSTVPSNSSKRECEEELQEMFLMLAQIGPDAMMRMILRKLPHERTVEDLEIIYEELLHIKALSHLSTMVKRELASVLVFESHAKSGTVLFNQGDEGKSWYIILKGSVNVVIYGKGVVCTLHEGDDFGKLALVNDAPRAATIVLRDDNCHFLRVDKDDFNRILRDVEANTVRLKEHGQDVLVLEKIPSNTQTSDGIVHAHYKYSVMAGTPEKMLEHLLETRLDNKKEDEIDGFLEDFILTHVIFMPCNHLCPVLLSHYHSSATETTEQEGFEFMFNHKKCVLHFVQEWSSIVGHAFKEDHTINAFLEELHSCVLDDLVSYPALRDDLVTLETVLQAQTEIAEGKSKKRTSGNFTLSRKPSSKEQEYQGKKKSIRPADENIFKVYCADHTYSTLKLSMDTNVENLLLNIKEKLGLGDDLILCEVKSSGERIILKENDLCVTSGLSINGRLFVTPKEHLDALTPLPEQEGPSDGTFTTIETFSSREMAYYMTLYDWDLFMSVQEYELIYQVFGRYKFQKITANLDHFLRRFNEIQFWIVTEMVLTTQLSKRVALLRKFIKLAAHCKEYQNLNSFFAVVMGLSNIAVSRLSQTWEKLPSKFKKMFVEFETLMDPSRNHRVYRLTVAKMAPPILPFMPLLMKDMTFTHEGNKTYFDGLVNFEKMRMISQTLKTVKFCRKTNIDIDMPGSSKSADAISYIRNFRVIDNQRLLTQLSHKLEPRKT